MIPVSMVLAVIAAFCLLPSLYYGARQDLKEFKFSASHFDSLAVNAAIVFTVAMYLMLVVEGAWFTAVTFVLLSAFASMMFLGLGIRFGGGGDWRALIYIAWISSPILISTIILSAIFGAVQAIYWVLRPDIITPPLFRKIPFAVSIFLGYLSALLIFIAGTFISV